MANPEGLPVSFNLTVQNEGLIRANDAVRMHTLGQNPPHGSEVYQINQIAQARMRTASFT